MLISDFNTIGFMERVFNKRIYPESEVLKAVNRVNGLGTELKCLEAELNEVNGMLKTSNKLKDAALKDNALLKESCDNYTGIVAKLEARNVTDSDEIYTLRLKNSEISTRYEDAMKRLNEASKKLTTVEGNYTKLLDVSASDVNRYKVELEKKSLELEGLNAKLDAVNVELNNKDVSIAVKNKEHETKIAELLKVIEERDNTISELSNTTVDAVKGGVDNSEPSEEIIADIKKKRAGGLSFNAIAKLTGLSRYKVTEICKKD